MNGRQLGLVFVRSRSGVTTRDRWHGPFGPFSLSCVELPIDMPQPTRYSAEIKAVLNVEARAANLLTTSDLAPLRRMLGPRSMVVRVNDDGSLAPFEIMPDLFLGRTIRQVLTADLCPAFETACADAVARLEARIFSMGDGEQVMITPVVDEKTGACRFLVCWARNDAHLLAEADGASAGWDDLTIDEVEVRYRAKGPATIEATPWWAIGTEGIALWPHHQRVSAVGLTQPVMVDLITEAIAVLAGDDRINVRVDIPSADALPGLVPIFHSVLKAAAVDPARIEVGVPVEMAVDPDLLPVIVHLRTLGLQMDIVGLDALTAKLHTVSDTSDHVHELPAPVDQTASGSWTSDPAEAASDAA